MNVVKMTVAAVFAASFALNAENLLKADSFSKENGWNVFINKPVAEIGATVKFDGGKAVINLPATTENKQHFIQVYAPLELVQGKSYKMTFTADSTKEGNIHISYLLSKAPYTSYANGNVKLAVGSKDYEITLTPKADSKGGYDSPRSIRFMTGALAESTITLSKVVIEEVPAK